MKNKPVKLSPRAALFIGAALLSTPALAQEQSVAPPPVVTTVAPAPGPPPAPAITFAPQAPTVQAVPEAVEAAAPAPTRTARHTTTTTSTSARQATVRPAPAPAPASAQASDVAPASVSAPVAVAPPVTTTTTTDTSTTQAAPANTAPAAPSTPIWPWALLGALILAGAAVALMLRRRRYDEAGVVPVREEPVARAERKQPFEADIPAPRVAPIEVAEAAPFVAPPVIVEAPAASEDPIETEAVIHEAGKSDLAAVAGAHAPVDHRPWLEFGMRPVRAGTTEDEATVEIELTVGNTGDMPAKNVRITTFMLADSDGSDLEQMLLDHANDVDVPPVSIHPGEGTRVDATLAAPKGDMGRTFNPVVVADARYKLPDGSEGRTAAAFRIGRMGVEGLGAIGASRPHIVENVDAELDQLLERA